MAAVSFRWILQLHRDVPKAAKFYSQGLDFTVNVCTLRWAELQSGPLKLALMQSPRVGVRVLSTIWVLNIVLGFREWCFCLESGCHILSLSLLHLPAEPEDGDTYLLENRSWFNLLN
ncbi:hypothetical protein SLEP1_g32974 [Rubroshorea leprosula]|uniref:Glyoxalase/fosfomycin resistance/dioxygenase domain-containing protein n=1 Tax=Rubroshorea leprosula TaxID=152421 RepID=A0AAV5KF93_9ROSI|nr:hypothetical protein SLEP1_g32974 [Rubroshorea leprosula]